MLLSYPSDIALESRSSQPERPTPPVQRQAPSSRAAEFAICDETIEHRHRSAKGPLRVRPLFVTSNQRIVGLITILGIALLVFSLLERAARRALSPGAKVPNLLAGHVAARPTGDNLLKALSTISLVTLEFAGTPHRAPSVFTPLHRTVLQLLTVSEDAYARLAA